MNAPLTRFAVFAYWLVVGYALAVRLLPRRQAVRNLLLAPAAGMAVTELALFTAMRLCGPVRPLCVPVVGGLFAAACASLVLSRPPVPIRRYAPFAALIVSAYLLTGWPQLRYGFNWV